MNHATGILAAHLNIDAPAALARLRAHAYTTGCSTTAAATQSSPVISASPAADSAHRSHPNTSKQWHTRARRVLSKLLIHNVFRLLILLYELSFLASIEVSGNATWAVQARSSQPTTVARMISNATVATA